MCVKYLGLLAKKYKRVKCGIAWLTLTAKILQFAAACGVELEDFYASPGWIQNMFSRNNIIGLNLHGGATI